MGDVAFESMALCIRVKISAKKPPARATESRNDNTSATSKVTSMMMSVQQPCPRAKGEHSVAALLFRCTAADTLCACRTSLASALTSGALPARGRCKRNRVSSGGVNGAVCGGAIRRWQSPLRRLGPAGALWGHSVTASVSAPLTVRGELLMGLCHRVPEEDGVCVDKRPRSIPRGLIDRLC